MSIGTQYYQHVQLYLRNCHQGCRSISDITYLMNIKKAYIVRSKRSMAANQPAYSDIRYETDAQVVVSAMK
jgi:hypothetical protein